MSTLAISPADQADKTRFALFYLKSNDATKAAMEVDPVNIGRALRIANTWLADQFVQDEIQRLMDEKGAGSFLESKEEILNDIRKRAKNTNDNEMYVKIMDLYCKVRGFIEKPGMSPLNIALQSVMIVRSQGSNEDWERSASMSQRELISANSD